jgi:catechol 2,3-dioxygenase
MEFEIHPQTRIGHIHLKVANLEQSLKFYRDLLGFQVTAFYGEGAVFLSAGGYHHHIGLNTWSSKDGNPPEDGHTGLFHFAILLPDRKELARVFKRLWETNYPIEGASDHGVSESIYLRDPDDNGIEFYSDRPEEEWPVDPRGNIIMTTKSLDVPGLLSELADED